MSQATETLQRPTPSDSQPSDTTAFDQAGPAERKQKATAVNDNAGPEPPGLSPTEAKRRDLRRMKWVATACFGLAAVLFIVAHGRGGFWIGLLEAVAEAAMVGALADWFAVTALFRHPLGLPIPHTAIISKKKDAIGDALGTFVESHFLNAETISEQLEHVDVAERIGLWLNDPRNTRHVAGIALSHAPAVLDRLRDERVTDFVHEHVLGHLKEADLKPVLQRAVAAFLRGDNPQNVVRAVLAQTGVVLHDNQQRLLDALDQLLPRILTIFGLSGYTVTRVRSTLEAMIQDENHPLRRQIVAMILVEARKQQHNETARAWVDGLQFRLAGHQETGAVVRDVWNQLTGAVSHDLERGDASRILTALEDSAAHLGRQILLNPDFQDAINDAVRDSAAAVVRSQGSVVSQLISEKVRGWDEKEVVENIELNVGRDLQFIRINGTLVGGLIGGIIYLAAYFA